MKICLNVNHKSEKLCTRTSGFMDSYAQFLLLDQTLNQNNSGPFGSLGMLLAVNLSWDQA